MIEKTLSMWVTVDRGRLLERFTSEELLTEVASRQATPIPEAEQERRDMLMDAITEAMDYLKSGRTDDALLTLERTAFPKFKSLNHAKAQYLRRVAR